MGRICAATWFDIQGILAHLVINSESAAHVESFEMDAAPHEREGEILEALHGFGMNGGIEDLRADMRVQAHEPQISQREDPVNDFLGDLDIDAEFYFPCGPWRCSRGCGRPRRD